MKNILYLILFLLIPLRTNAQNLGKVTVTVQEIKAAGEGNLVIMLFTTDKGFPMEKDNAKFKTVLTDFNSEAAYTFIDIPYGSYGLSVFQDKNKNGKLDTRRLLPMPKEPVGALNLTKVSRPKFEDSSFILDSDSVSVTLTLINQ